MTATRNMTEDQLRALPIRVGIKTVAAALGVGINEAYRQAADAGEIGGEGSGTCPVRKRGGAWVAYRPELFRAVGLDPSMVRVPEQTAEAP
jgi:hypothetical protein